MKKYEKYLMNLIKKYQPILLLDKFTFQLELDDDDDNYFANSFRYPYLNAVIYYSKKSFKDWKKNKKDMTNYIIHEMCHSITDPLYSKSLERFTSRSEVENERELLTDYITNIIIKNNL